MGRWRTGILLVHSIVYAVVHTSMLWGGTGVLFVRPTRQTLPTSRLHMTVDTSWVEASGIRPVRVTFRPIGSTVFPADRRLVVEIRPGRWNSPSQTRLQSSREVDLPEGAESATVTVYVPQDSVYGVYAIHIYEDGKPLKDLTEEEGVRVSAANWGQSLESAPTTIVIDKNVVSLYERRTADGGSRSFNLEVNSNHVPDIGALAMFTSVSAVGNVSPAAQLKNANWYQISSLASNIEFLRPTDLPDTLAGFASLDLIIIEGEELQHLKKEQRAAYEMIRRWLFAGGNLCMTGASEDFTKLDEIDSMLALPPAGSATWTYPRSEDYGKPTHEFRVPGQQQTIDDSLRSGSAPDKPPFAIRTAMLGHVVALAHDCDDLDINLWNWLLESLPETNWKWNVRNGLTLQGLNDGFWDFLIPGVGLPPVNWFRALLTIFVIVIGPLNYFLLRRRGRLSWLLFTVPLGATVAIAGLVCFALFTDGLSVRARIRSVTHIDQRISHAVSWSRQAYYAGVAPGDGLIYPDDAVVLPLDYRPPIYDSMFGGTRRVVQHRGRKVSYRVGYLPSRTTVQYTVLRSRKSELGVRLSRDADGTLRARNQLDGRIQQLYVRDVGGKFFEASNIDDGGAAKLIGTDMDAIQSELGKIFRSVALEAPDGLDKSMLQNELFFSINQAAPGSRGHHGNRTAIMEKRLVEAEHALSSLVGPASYLAIVDDCGEIPLGVSNCKQAKSIHVVTGRY